MNDDDFRRWTKDKPSFQIEAANQPYADDLYRNMGREPNREISNRNYDLALTDETGTKLAEEKFLQIQPRHYVLIELMQCIITPELGWYHDLKSDELNWFYGCNPNGTKPPSYAFIGQWFEIKDEVNNALSGESRWIQDKEFWLENGGHGHTLNLAIPWGALLDLGLISRFKTGLDGKWRGLDNNKE